MTTEVDTHLDRRTVLKFAGAALVFGSGSTAGVAGAVAPGTAPSVAFASQTAMRSPRGVAVRTDATLPDGGYVAIFEGDTADPEELIGVNPDALGRGAFRELLIAVADLGPGTHTLTAALYRDDGDHRFELDDLNDSYGATATAEIAF